MENRIKCNCKKWNIKEKSPYLQKMEHIGRNSLYVQLHRKGLYIVVAATTADALFCRIGLKSQPYPRKKCITVSHRLSAEKGNQRKREVAL